MRGLILPLAFLFCLCSSFVWSLALLDLLRRPRCRKRMEARIRDTGKLLGQQVVATCLKPGKRGCYRMSLSFPSGWDSWRDEEITVGDDIPFRPWIAIRPATAAARFTGGAIRCAS
jgi:hypothetical protein